MSTIGTSVHAVVTALTQDALAASDAWEPKVPERQILVAPRAVVVGVYEFAVADGAKPLHFDQAVFAHGARPLATRAGVQWAFLVLHADLTATDGKSGLIRQFEDPIQGGVHLTVFLELDEG